MAEKKTLMDIDLSTIKSVALRRLIEEVRDDRVKGVGLHAYDRIHNRHNR